jgi:rhomboid protease GluP
MSLIRRLPEAPVTLALIVANLLVFAAMVVLSRRIVSFDSAILVGAGSSVYHPPLDMSVFRWLTAAFIHVNLLHIVMNLWVLAQIGILSERALGRGLVAAAYVVTGVLGNVVSIAIAAFRGEPKISAGASGAIMGLIGMAAMFAWMTGQRAAAKALATNVLFVLGVGVALSVRGSSPIDNAAHVGGLVAGIAIGLVRARYPAPMPRWAEAVLIAASAVLTIVAFLVVQLLPG